MSLRIILILLVLVLVIFNLFVLASLLKRSDISRSQKYLQTLVVLALPFLGGAIIWSFHKSEDQKEPDRKSDGSGSDLGGYI
jgi:hypothetical protein